MIAKTAHAPLSAAAMEASWEKSASMTSAPRFLSSMEMGLEALRVMARMR